MPRTKQANRQIREETRDRVLDAARKVFARKGIAATISEVAAEAGISQGLAYRYFPSKEAILATLIRQMSESGGGFSARFKEISGSPRERLAYFVSSVLESRREQPELYQLVYQVLNDDKVPNDLREVVGRSGRAIRSTMRQLIVEGQERGEVATDDPDQLVEAILACLDGLSRRMVTLEPDEARAMLPDAEVILRMLEPESSR
jgi:AcrR family transcriptional regulator